MSAEGWGGAGGKDDDPKLFSGRNEKELPEFPVSLYSCTLEEVRSVLFSGLILFSAILVHLDLSSGSQS